jgi:hypothetical protein
LGSRLKSLVVDAGYDVINTMSGLAGSAVGLSDDGRRELSNNVGAARTHDLKSVSSPTAHSEAGHAPAGDQSTTSTVHGGEDRNSIDLDHVDLVDLAGRIYPDIRSRLRHELLLDRERAGLLSDFR